MITEVENGNNKFTKFVEGKKRLSPRTLFLQ